MTFHARSVTAHGVCLLLIAMAVAASGQDADGLPARLRVVLDNTAPLRTPRGKRRIHERPNREEILACRLWLDEEIARLKPDAIVALGATAAGVVIGPGARVTRDRARPVPSPLAPVVTLTVHPSSILRSPDDRDRRAARRQFVQDLKTIMKLMQKNA